MSEDNPLGDMSADEFRRHGHAMVEWIARFMEDPGRYPVLAKVAPGDIRSALPDAAPETAEAFDAIMADFDRILMPGMTHWNHPGFMAYFAISASAPGVLADFVASALNQQAMLWRTSPAATELEAVAMGWLRRLIGLPDAFEGVIYDTASVSSLHALAAAREAAVPEVRRLGLAGRTDVPRLRVYCSDQAHSSIDKGVILAGFGHEALRRLPSDPDFRMRPDVLARRDRRGSRGGFPARRGRRHRRHDVDDERRSRGGHRRRLRGRARVAARRLRVRRRGGHAARARAHPGRRRAGGLAGRESAQVAVHAVRSQRLLLPPDGRHPPGLLADARVPRRRPTRRAT